MLYKLYKNRLTIKTKCIILNTAWETAVTDKDIIKEFLVSAQRRALTVEQMAAEVGMSKSWGEFIHLGKIRRLQFRTRSLILKHLGKI